MNGSSQRRCPLYVPSGMHLGIWNDMLSRVSQREDLSSLPWQIYLMETIGATRTNESKVVEIECAE